MVKQFVNELEIGGFVDSDFAVVEKGQIKPYGGGKGCWFTLTVMDRTDKLLVKYWGSPNEEEVKSKFSSIKVQDIVHVKGTVGEYKGRKEISVNLDSGNITKTTEFNPEDFIPVTEKNIDEMKSELKKIISEIKNFDIKRLLENFFNEDTFLEKFSKSPAASTRHHNYVGGLLEHVLSLIQISQNVAKIHSELDVDLLIAGCIFHDIGKIEEYQVSNTISYTDQGRLFGHIMIGQLLVSEKIKQLENFPTVLADKIIHMILSHHGILEWGSPVIPAFPEAIALHYIDQVDAKIKGALQEKNTVISDEDWIRTRDYGQLFLK